MSSHREAPGISQDPVADNTDLYAFISPDRPKYVAIIANYLPLEYPPGGPNFFEFGDDVLYEIHIDNDGDAIADITYQFEFSTSVLDPNTFLYNTGQILSLDSPNWNRRQSCTVTKVHEDGRSKVLGAGLICPPCNVGIRSTPNYETLAEGAIHRLSASETVFTGQRNDPFYVDLGSIFDLGTLRPFENLHVIPTPAAPGVNALREFSVHSIAMQVETGKLTRTGTAPTDPSDRASVIGIWATASRRMSIVREDDGTMVETGPWVQVSRLGNPLFNEVIVPMGEKDYWNALDPSQDSKFVDYVGHPELAGLLPVLYPGVFPNLAGLSAERKDLEAILLTGIPAGLIPGFQNYTGPTPADMLRLNVSIPPTKKPNIYGLLGGDLAGFPNGRRLVDDVTAIELRAIAGVTYPLIDPSYTPDAAAGQLTDGLTPADNPTPFLKHFPYVGTPQNGYSVVPPSQ